KRVQPVSQRLRPWKRNVRQWRSCCGLLSQQKRCAEKADAAEYPGSRLLRQLVQLPSSAQESAARPAPWSPARLPRGMHAAQHRCFGIDRDVVEGTLVPAD